MSLKKNKNNEDSFDALSSVFSVKENVREKNSKAYVAAMKALQEKLEEVQKENCFLKGKLLETDAKRTTDRRLFELGLQEERKKAEKLFKQKITELEAIEKELQKTVKKLNDTVKLLETKVRFNEDQVARLNEQTALDKENFQLELECAKKSASESKSAEKELKDLILKEKREKKLLAVKLEEQAKLEESLRKEIEYLAEHNKEHHERVEENFKKIKSELLVKNQENLQMIKHLNIKNKNLQKIANDSKKQGEYFKVQCIKLAQNAREFKEVNKSLKKSRSRSKNFESANPTFRRSVSSFKFTENSDLNVEDEGLGKAIVSKEGEIKRLSDRYSKLQSMEFETNEIESCQRDLEDICLNIQKKNRELADLKKKQREILRLKLVA